MRTRVLCLSHIFQMFAQSDPSFESCSKSPICGREPWTMDIQDTQFSPCSQYSVASFTLTFYTKDKQCKDLLMITHLSMANQFIFWIVFHKFRQTDRQIDFLLYFTKIIFCTTGPALPRKSEQAIKFKKIRKNILSHNRQKVSNDILLSTKVNIQQFQYKKLELCQFKYLNHVSSSISCSDVSCSGRNVDNLENMEKNMENLEKKNCKSLEKPGKALASLTLSSSSWTTVAATHLSLPYEAEQQNGQWTRHLGKIFSVICTSFCPTKPKIN